MKRGKFFFIFTLFGSILGIAFLFYMPKKPLPEPYVHTDTWSSFSQVGQLQMLFSGFAIESMIDLPCSIFDRAPIKELSLTKYIGIADRQEMACSLQMQYGSEVCSFLSKDIKTDALPQVDLILCWDRLSSLSYNEVKAVLLQFQKSGAKFLLLRHFPQIKENPMQKSGVYAKINWRLPPYSFPEPIVDIWEEKEGKIESLALWNLEKLFPSLFALLSR